MKIVTASEMREIDRVTIEERGVPGIELMERAGEAITRVLLEKYNPGVVAVVTGKGNNAGDGFVIARLLAEDGVRVRCVMLAPGESLKGDALTNYQRLPEAVGQVVEESGQIAASLSGFPVIVDAMLGTGTQGAVEGSFGAAIANLNFAKREYNCSIVAVDIPSGMQADGGWTGNVVQADLTVTIGLPKLGVMVYPGFMFCGEVQVESIGFPEDLLQSESLPAELLEMPMIRKVLPSRPPQNHKGSFGRVLIVAGSAGMTGAALLAAEGALRSGAGLVHVALEQSLNAVFEATVMEAMSIPLAAKQPGRLDMQSLENILEWSEKVDGVALGPGMGQAPETRELISNLIARINKPLVIDADGLNALAGNLDVLKKRKAPTALTPHPGEMSRLCGLDVNDVSSNPIQVARDFAQQHGVVLVLKGARTVIATPQGDIAVNPTGNTALAKGGSGDVLTGLLVGLLVQGLNQNGEWMARVTFQAAKIAVYLHGLAGELAAEQLGERAALPRDVLAHIGAAYQKIEGCR